MIIKEIDNGPSIHIGNARVVEKSIFGIFQGVDNEAGAKVASTLPDIFTRGGEKEIGNDEEDNRQSVEGKNSEFCKTGVA